MPLRIELKANPAAMFSARPSILAEAEPRKSESKSTAESPEIEKLVSALALLIYNTMKGLWVSSSDRYSCISGRYPVLIKAIEKVGQIRFALLKGELLVNGIPYSSENRHVKAFVSHLLDIDASYFAFNTGVTEEEFTQLLDVLCLPAAELRADGFVAVMARRNCAHIVAKKIALKEVAENELIVDSAIIDEDAVAKLERAKATVMDMLNRGNGTYSEESVAGVFAMAKDPGELAAVIMDSVQARRVGACGASESSPNKLLVECLESAVEGLMRHPSFTTQKGKADIRKLLQKLETELLARLGPVAAETGVEKDIAEAVRHITEGLKTARLAAEYTHRLKALEASEKEILRFIKAQGLDRVKRGDLEKQLSDGGMDIAGWHKLLARSAMLDKQARPVPDADAEESAKAIQNMAALLARLNERINQEQWTQASPVADQLVGELKEMNEQVATMTNRTTEKIQDLVHALNSDLEEIDGHERLTQMAGAGPLLTRGQVAEKLGEIVRELAQPLGMIRCSLDMLLSKATGEISPGQHELLNVAAQSADQIRRLIGALEMIAAAAAALYQPQSAEISGGRPAEARTP